MATILDGMPGGKHNSDNIEVTLCSSKISSEFKLGYKPKRATMLQHLIEYQIGLIGKTMVDTYNDDRWHQKWTLTSEQKKQFYKYSIKVIKKVFRCNTSRAIETYDWFNLVFGLKVKNK